MSRIYCSVNNCHYYSAGNVCIASEILVTHDRVGSEMPDNFDAPQHQQVAATPAQTCMETCCKTFVPKGGQHTNVDGVYKSNQFKSQNQNNNPRMS